MTVVKKSSKTEREYYSALARRLDDTLRDAGVAERAIAERAGVSKTTYGSAIRRLRLGGTMELRPLVRLHEATGKNLTWLLTGEGAQTKLTLLPTATNARERAAELARLLEFPRAAIKATIATTTPDRALWTAWEWLIAIAREAEVRTGRAYLPRDSSQATSNSSKVGD